MEELLIGVYPTNLGLVQLDAVAHKGNTQEQEVMGDTAAYSCACAGSRGDDFLPILAAVLWKSTRHFCKGEQRGASQSSSCDGAFPSLGLFWAVLHIKGLSRILYRQALCVSLEEAAQLGQGFRLVADVVVI